MLSELEPRTTILAAGMPGRPIVPEEDAPDELPDDAPDEDED